MSRAELLVRLGSRSWRFTAGTVVLVGRGDDCDVAVDDPRVSRRHLRIDYQDGWVVQDLRSTGGSWVGGSRLIRRRLTGAVEVRLADATDGCTVELRIDPPPGPPVESRREGHYVTVGRDSANDIVLDDVQVSRRHARLDRTRVGWRISDLGSRNGVLVNAVRITNPADVRNGDRLTFGSTDLVVDGDDFVPTATDQAELTASEAGYTLSSGRKLLGGVSLRVRPGELVAVVGPSGAGKSTLLKVLTGQLRPTEGTVSYDGYDMHDNAELMRGRVGLVPQDDLVHRNLTPRQALSYSAMLRLPPDTSRAERNAIVDATLDELDLSERADVRIGRLSGGQRKRVSVALELLTSPSLLLLDEPTSGLDPALDRQLMSNLRSIADGGRSVVVVTHNVANLGLCDTVLVLAAGGIPVYVGSPESLADQFGTNDWADVFAAIVQGLVVPQAGAPIGRRTRPQGSAPAPVPGAPLGQQIGILMRRHTRLIVTDRGYAWFLLLLPIVLGILALAVPGKAGLHNGSALEAGEAGQILVLVFVGAGFMGGAVSAREVIGERDIVLRERASGVLTTSYALAKSAVFAVVCAGQAVLLVGVLVLVKPPPRAGLLFSPATIELTLAVWATAAASCLLGLLGSAVVRSTEQTMPLLVVTVMAQLVLCGGMIPVTGRPVISELSWLVPSRWGYAAGAATVDLNAAPAAQPVDPLWRHSGYAWCGAIAVLVAYSIVYAAALAARVRRMRHG